MTAVRERSLVREPALWQTVGNTPLLPVELPDGAGRFWLKAEWLNPGGSVKDRAARSILRDAIRRGLVPGRRLLDASSGNTGIAYAMLGAAAGVGVTICLPGNASPERRALQSANPRSRPTPDRPRWCRVPRAGTPPATPRTCRRVPGAPG